MNVVDDKKLNSDIPKTASYKNLRLTQAMKNSCLGFTLVELMVVTGIIAVLAGVAIPLYANHMSKAQVVRVVSEISSYRQPVEMRVLNNTIVVAVQSPNTSLGFIDSNLSTVTFGTFLDSSSSYISAELNENSNSGIHGTEVIITRSSDGAWSCIINGFGSGWSDKFKPTNCQ